MEKCKVCDIEIRTRLKIFKVAGKYELGYPENFRRCLYCGREYITHEQHIRNVNLKTQAIKSFEAGVREARGRMLAMG